MQHALKTLEEMTGVPIAEIRLIRRETLYETDLIELDKILDTDSSVAALTIKDWFSTGNECNVPRMDFADFDNFFCGQYPISVEPSPLKFVIVDGDRAGDLLVMENATGRSTIRNIVEWMSSESVNREEGAVSFFFEKFRQDSIFSAS